MTHVIFSHSCNIYLVRSSVLRNCAGHRMRHVAASCSSPKFARCFHFLSPRDPPATWRNPACPHSLTGKHLCIAGMRPPFISATWRHLCQLTTGPDLHAMCHDSACPLCLSREHVGFAGMRMSSIITTWHDPTPLFQTDRPSPTPSPVGPHLPHGRNTQTRIIYPVRSCLLRACARRSSLLRGRNP